MKNVFASFLVFLCCSVFSQTTNGIFAEIVTNKGNIIIQLTYDKAPITVANFIGLAEGKIQNSHKELGQPYYDGLTFHRVVQNGIVQGGCPLGNGEGNPGYKFKDEFHSDLKHDKVGVVSMANSGKNSNGSQFFITHRAIPSLDGIHSIFGQVVEGQEIIMKIIEGDIIQSLKIIRNGKSAEAFDVHTVFPDKMRKKQ